MNHFELFNLPVELDIDFATLKAEFLKLQQQYHPDKAEDSRWVHRPVFDWRRAGRRTGAGGWRLSRLRPRGHAPHRHRPGSHRNRARSAVHPALSDPRRRVKNAR